MREGMQRRRGLNRTPGFRRGPDGLNSRRRYEARVAACAYLYFDLELEDATRDGRPEANELTNLRDISLLWYADSLFLLNGPTRPPVRQNLRRTLDSFSEGDSWSYLRFEKRHMRIIIRKI